ncbi:MAG TPA: MOSC domain-containing protein [Chloroflexota bacterium]|nr:MOSC domain-containing protein [Chloroflexota bacterium]
MSEHPRHTPGSYPDDAERLLVGHRLEIVSVNVARPSLLVRWPSRDVLSAIDKRPVAAPTLRLTALNLDGDEQADQRTTPQGGQVHGGPDQAVYAFPVEHYSAFERELGRSLAPGFVGENLTTGGATEADTCIGDVWAWGDALLQVAAPRGPCFKLGYRLGRHALRTWVREAGLVGWYMRVLRPGTVPTDGHLEVVSRHPARVTVAEVHRALQRPGIGAPHLLELEPLATRVRNWLRAADRDMTGGFPERDA